MTISGYINGSYTGYAGRYEVRLAYEYSQNIAGNYSLMEKCELQIRSISSSADGAYSDQGITSMSYAGYEVNRGGVSYDFSWDSDPGPWVTVASLNNKIINHASDGSKIIYISAAFWSNDPQINSILKADVSTQLVLRSIPRYSTFGTLTPFVIEQPWSVSVNKYIASETDTLTITYDTFTKTVTPYVSGQQIQFTQAELAELYALTPNLSEIPFTLTITTGSLGSSTATLNGTITPVAPTFEATITANPSVAVSGQTTVVVTLSEGGTAHEGGTIAEYVVSLGSQTIRANSSSATFAFQHADGDTITAQAVDSRGWASSAITQTITLYPYAMPSVTVSVSRTPTMADTTAQLTMSGTYAVVPNQTLTGSYRYRESGGTWSTAQSITLTYSGGTWSFSATLLDTFSIANVYEFEVTVSDLYQSVIATATLLSAEPTIDIDTSNQRVKIGGFLGTEDDQSLSVVGDIYEGGQKLSEKYGSGTTLTEYSYRTSSSANSQTAMSKSWTVSGNGFVHVSVTCIASAADDYGTTASQINRAGTVMARSCNREDTNDTAQYATCASILMAVTNGQVIACTCGSTKDGTETGIFEAVAINCTLT